MSKKYTVNKGFMSLSTYYLEDDRHLARLHRCRRRRAYAPTSNTASHDNNEKITSCVTFSFLYGYGAPLGDLSGRWSSAISEPRKQSFHKYNPYEFLGPRSRNKKTPHPLLLNSFFHS